MVTVGMISIFDNGGTAIALSNNRSVGNPDFLDDDSDGDGVPDWIEGFDSNENGDALDDLRSRATIYEDNTASEVYINAYDNDEDLIPDWIEDNNSNGIPNFLESHLMDIIEIRTEMAN